MVEVHGKWSIHIHITKFTLTLRGHLGAPDTVYEPLIFPLNHCGTANFREQKIFANFRRFVKISCRLILPAESLQKFTARELPMGHIRENFLFYSILLSSEIECFHRYWNSASGTPRYPIKVKVSHTTSFPPTKLYPVLPMTITSNHNFTEG